jgi:hypothetical protein
VYLDVIGAGSPRDSPHESRARNPYTQVEIPRPPPTPGGPPADSPAGRRCCC